MTAGRILTVVVALAIFSIGGLYAVDAALIGAGPTTTVTDEEFEPVGGTVVELEFSNLDHGEYSETVTVTDNQGNIFPDQGNYTWFTSNGTIFINNTGALASENSAFIDYSVSDPLEEGRGFYSMFVTVFELNRYLIMGLVVVAGLAAVRVLGGG